MSSIEIVKRLGFDYAAEDKNIYTDDSYKLVAEKMFKHFNIGDKIKFYGVEPVFFKWKKPPFQLPKDMACEIVGAPGGYYVVYPKGFLVTMMLEHRSQGKQFVSTVQIDNQGKHFYEIWRSR